MSITREQLDLAIATVLKGGDGAEYIFAANLLADVGRGEEVIDFCAGSGDAPDGDECSACFYKHGLIVPEHHYVEA